MSELRNFVKVAICIKNISIDGLMSHLATADNPKARETKTQLKNFEEAAAILEEFNIRPKWRHIAASSGLLRIAKSKLAKISNLSRVGLALYGIDPDKKIDHLVKPVLSLSSQIVQIKKLEVGDFIGYAATFNVTKPMRIGILPIGYNDGVDRRLSNTGSVQIHGKNTKILGRVSMNITVIDLTNINAKVGDAVTIYSSDQKDKNSIYNSAARCKTIPYDLLVHLSPVSIKRQIV